MLSIPEGESVDYPFLNGRFKDGLAAISNSIAQRLDTPRQVTVAGKTMILNATNAEGTIHILCKHILLPCVHCVLKWVLRGHFLLKSELISIKF